MLTQSKDMAEKQNPSRTWYISLTIICNSNMSSRTLNPDGPSPVNGQGIR